MNIKRILLSTTLILSFGYSVDLSKIDKIEYDKIIKKACYQKNLIQKAYKNYILLGTNNTYKNPEMMMKYSLTDYENNLKDIKSFVEKNKFTDKNLLTYLDEQEDLFDSLEMKINDKKTKITKESALKILPDVATLIEASNETCSNLITLSRDETKWIIADVEEQASASGRVACLYMVKSWGVKNPEINKRINEEIENFEDNLEELRESEDTTPEIEKLLSDSENLFRYLKVMNKSETSFIPTLVSRNADKIEENMEKATELYLEERQRKADEKED